VSLTFDAATHTYRFGGSVVRSVTQHLQALHSFAGVPLDVLEAAQERGTYVHKMCELFDLGELDEVENAKIEGGRYVGYLDAWKRFIDDFRPNWSGIECMGYSPLYRFAGAMDRHGTFERKAPGRWIPDIKTSLQPHRVWGLQTAAYRQLLAEQDPAHALDQRATVQLAANGAYKFIQWTDPADWPTFQALVTLNNWSTK
jgi:hypothetical protein